MKKIYKMLMSVLLILALVSTAISVGAKEKDTKKSEEPVAADEASTTVEVVGQATIEQATTYTDIWTASSTYHFWPTLNAWRDVTGMTQTINLRYPSTVIVQFSSEAGTRAADDFGSSASKILVRATIDGSVMQPGAVILSENSDYESNSFTFRRDYLSAGTHTIKIQANKYIISGDGAAGDLWKKTVTVIANGYGH